MLTMLTDSPYRIPAGYFGPHDRTHYCDKYRMAVTGINFRNTSEFVRIKRKLHEHFDRCPICCTEEDLVAEGIIGTDQRIHSALEGMTI